MVHMAKPWRHPDTKVYYLRRQVPEAIRGEIGKSLWKASLHTREPAEAARRFLIANAELEERFAEARAAIVAQAVRDEMSAERATAVVDAFLTARASPTEKRWASLPLTWWLEESASRLEGATSTGALPSIDASGRHDFALTEGVPIVGDTWLRFVQRVPRSTWMEACAAVLDPLFESAAPPVPRTPVNEGRIMDAWNARVLLDNARVYADRDTPRRSLPAPRVRPDLRLRTLLDEWNGAQRPRPQTLHETSRAVEDFIDWFGDIAVASITSDMLYDYRDAGRRLPKSMPRADRSLSFQERLARHVTTAGQRVSAATVKKRIGAIQALLSFAHQERWISENVGTRIRITGYTRTVKARRSFRDGELAALFGDPLFTRPASWFVRRTKVSDLTLYWLFLLGLTSGARLEEVGQARLVDLKTDAGVLFIDIDERETEGGDADDADKKIKNANSRRVIPIHDRLIRLGFEKYCDELRRRGQSLLFPDLESSQFGKYTKEASRRANRFINRVVTNDKRLVFHSLRHKFKDEGRDAGVQDSVLDQITGHSPATVGARYGEGAALKSLKRDLVRLTYTAVDWEALERSASLVDWKSTVSALLRRIASRGA